MDKLLTQICKLLDRDDVELQCSAARVLAELAPRSGEVRLAIARHLSTTNLTVKHYLLLALEKNTGAEAFPFLFPLLREGGKIQERVSRIIASAGGGAVTEVKKLFPRADAELRKLLMQILGIVGTEQACRFLIECIAEDGPEMSRQACLVLREAIGRMDRPGKKALLKKLNVFIASPAVRASAEKTAACVVLLGSLADPSSLGRLLKCAMGDQPTPVREQALIALSHFEFPPAARDEVARGLIPMLNEDNYPNIVRHALAVLQRIELPRKLAARLEGLLRSRHPAVRSFALSRMGAVGTRENIERLLEHLNAGDFEERRAAQEALAATPKSYPYVIKALDQAKDHEGGMRLVSILKVQGAQVGMADKRRLFDLMEKLWKAGDERHALYAAALNVADAEFFAERAGDRARRLKSARKFKESEEFLRILSRHSTIPDELKFELAVLRLRNTPPDLSPLRRKDDEGLNLLGELVGKEGFPLLKLLRGEKILGPDELYVIGFHFAEKLFAQREFGVALLTWLAKKSPRGKVGAAARQKLSLVGAAPQK